MKGRSRWVDVAGFKSEGGKGEAFLKGGWLVEGEGRGVQSWVESVGGGWVAEQVCFFYFFSVCWVCFWDGRGFWEGRREADGAFLLVVVVGLRGG